MNILIVKLSAIGDVLHTLPALNALRQTFPDARITWLVEEAAAALVEGHPALDRVLVCRRKSWIRDWRAGKRKKVVAEIADFVARLRDTVYDIVLDFQALLKGAVWIVLSRGKRKIGFDRGMEHMEHSYWFLNERIAPISMDVHALERNLVMLEPLGVRNVQKIVYRLPVTADHRDQAKRLLGPFSDAGPIVCINPVAKWETKLWTARGFAEVADRLAAEVGATVVFTGAKEDRNRIDSIRGRMTRHALDVSGKTDLLTLAALYDLADGVISTDTGPMHLAAAVGTSVVALFGPTAPWRTGPYGNRHRVIRLGTTCSPCFRRTCAKPICMQDIDAESVFKAIVDTLNDHPKSTFRMGPVTGRQ
ncbi:MAG: lipopolysaccharide heptosyltransferase I [Thermodesulfobacteriota bacterium]